MSAAYHRLALLLKKLTQKERENHGFIHWLSFLMVSTLVLKVWAPPTGTCDFSQCCSHDASKQTLLLCHFPPMPKSHKCLLDVLATGLVQPPQLVSFLAGCLLVNISGVSKRLCGYRAVIQGCNYDSAFGHHFQIAYYEHRLYWGCWRWRERLAHFYLGKRYQSLPFPNFYCFRVRERKDAERVFLYLKNNKRFGSGSAASSALPS